MGGVGKRGWKGGIDRDCRSSSESVVTSIVGRYVVMYEPIKKRAVVGRQGGEVISKVLNHLSSTRGRGRIRIAKDEGGVDASGRISR